MKTAAATIKGVEIMRMIRRGHCLTYKSPIFDVWCRVPSWGMSELAMRVSIHAPTWGATS
jgi:hypothetical protein